VTEYTFDDKDKVLNFFIEKQAKENKDTVFIRYEDEEITYGEMDEITNRFANSFLDLGIAKGDKVCLMLPNCSEFIYCWFGLSKVGAVYVPLNIYYKGDILQYVINQSDAKMLIVDSQLLDRVKFVENDLKNVNKVIVYTGKEGGEPSAVKTKFDQTHLENLFNGSPAKLDVDVQYSDLLAISFTSGTTGPSKGVMAPHAYVITFALDWIKANKYTSEDILYTPLPLFHAIATWLGVLPTLIAGTTIAIGQRFSASNFWDEIKKHKATVAHVIFSIPPILMKAPPKPDDAENTLRAMYIAQRNEEFEKRFGLRLVEVYGATEDGIVTYCPYDDPIRRGSCGKANSDIYEVKIFDEEDNELPPGEVGEIVVRPKKPFIMSQGYYNMPEATVQAWRNLWFHTGDGAYMDEDGYFYFADRKKDALRRRGENVSSYEIEKIVNAHPKVLESAAIAVKDDIAADYGTSTKEDEIKVCVVLKEGETLEAEELIRFCNDRMAYFMVPRYLEFIKGLPKTPTEKVEKFRLRERGITESTWDREKAGITLKR